MRCTARASPVGGARRHANAFSLCGLSLHAGCPPLLCGAHDIPLRLRDEFSSTRYERRTRHSASIARRILKHALRAARHGIPFPLHVEFKHAWRAQQGYVLHTQRTGHSSCCGLRSVHWPLRARRTHSRGAYLFFASMSAIDHDGARTTAVNLRHPFVVGIVRFKRCTQCFVLLVGGVVFDFHIDQAAHR